MRINSGDHGLDKSFAYLADEVAAIAPKARVVKVNASDLRQVLAQFKILVDEAKKPK